MPSRFFFFFFTKQRMVWGKTERTQHRVSINNNHLCDILSVPPFLFLISFIVHECDSRRSPSALETTTVPVLFRLPSFYGRGMPPSFLWGSPMWLSLVLKCLLSQKGLECTNPPLPAQPPLPRCHLNLNKVPLGSKSALSGGFFLPRAHIYYPFIIDEWPPGRQRRLSYRPGTFTILAHWPVSFFFFFPLSLSELLASAQQFSSRVLFKS